jgi:hypothetical protein
MNHIRISIQGDPENMDAAEALRVLRQMLTIVTAGAPTKRWRTVDLTVGSLILEAAPSTDDETIAQNSVQHANHRMDLINALTEGRPEASALSREDIGRIVRVGKKIGAATGITGVSLSVDTQVKAQVTTATITHGEAITEGQYESYGSVSGTLDLISSRGEKHIEISTEDDGPVRCDVPGSLWSLALTLMDQQVDVEGVLMRNAYGQRTRISAMKLKASDPTRLPIPVDELVGILGSDWTGGMDSVEWVRQQRER